MPAESPSQPRQNHHHHHTNIFISTDATVPGSYNFLLTKFEICSAARVHALPRRACSLGIDSRKRMVLREARFGRGQKLGLMKVNERTALESYASKETFDDAVSGGRDVWARVSVMKAQSWRRASCGDVSTRLALSVFQLPDMGTKSTRTDRADEVRASKLLMAFKCP